MRNEYLGPCGYSWMVPLVLVLLLLLWICVLLLEPMLWVCHLSESLKVVL